ncbi:uncharacterized protein LOC135840506 isoform X1 [Planococcus citri]|uniref:uncharacterized protein LOC135840506 isoform X1 n=1 Tax=Planococcus citri TaxID=170843 RepID=UPI0031F89AEC
MGCSNSKSTPIVDSNTDENIGQTMLKNGKAVMMDAENRLGEMKDAVHNAAANMEAKLLNSPLTQRAGCNETTDSNIANDGDFSDTDTNVEHEIPVTMTLSRDDDVDGGTSDKPSTPMPEDGYLSDQTLYNDSDSCGGNRDTMKSNIFEAVCNTAAELALQDTTDTECEDPRSGQYDDSDAFSSQSAAEADCESEFDFSRRRGSTGCDQRDQLNEARRMANDDTYVRLGRQLCNELESRRKKSGDVPCVLEMVKKANSRGRNGRVVRINADMQLKKNAKSLRY